MTACIDTNVVLGMFAAGHAHRPIYVVDAAIVAEARHVITSDRHFHVLSGQSGRPAAITPEKFIQDVLPAL